MDKEIIEILKEHEISEFYPPQAEALPYALKAENLVLSIPTASGKSLVAYLAIVNRLLAEGGKALYVVPLKALAREKYEELQLFERLGLKVGISTGDLDDSDPRLTRFDIVVCTSEKVDSLLRHKVNWMSKIKVLVIEVLRKRPYLKKEWCIRVLDNPVRSEPQEANRHRFWGQVPELEGRYLRVVTLADRVTIHNAFPDRRFKP